MRRMLHLRSTKLILTRIEGQRTIMGDLEGVVERLCDVGEVGSEGELGDDMRQIHDWEQFGQSQWKRVARTYDCGQRVLSLHSRARWL